MKRRTEIFVEIEEVTLTRRVRPPRLSWCDACAAEARMVTPCVAALLTGRTTRAIYRLVEAGLVHYVELPHCGPLVCLDTLDAGAAGPGRSGGP